MEEKKNKYIYRKIYNKEKKIKNIKYRNKINLNNNNNNYDRSTTDIIRHRKVKTNLFKSQDFEHMRDKSDNNINNRRQISNKKGKYNANLYFMNNEENKEKDKQIKNMIYRNKKKK